MNLEIKGHVAVVTGAGSGMGQCIAQELNKEGCFTYLLDKNEEGLHETYSYLEHKNNSEILKVDITDRNRLKTIVEKIITDNNKIDILISAAGIHSTAPFLEMTDEQFDNMIDVNLVGAYNIIHLVAPHMVNNQYGKIISITSIAGRIGSFTSASHYATAKGGLITLTYSLAKELGPKGINVNAIAPGQTDTPMGRNIDPKLSRAHIENLPKRRMGTPKDIKIRCLAPFSKDDMEHLMLVLKY